MSATNQTADGDLATIIESRSTNTASYRILIHNDGSATKESDGRLDVPPGSQDFPPSTVDTKTLRFLLTQIGDVSKIPTGPCPKSASCGTTTEISYAGKISGDLQSIPWYDSAVDPTQKEADEDLLKFVRTTETQLMTATCPSGKVFIK